MTAPGSLESKWNHNSE